MNIRRIKWLVIIVIHDFDDSINQGNLQKIIDEEILTEGINENHAVLLIQQSYSHKKKYKFRTRIAEVRKGKKRFKLVNIKRSEFDFHAERSWVKLMKWVASYYEADHICLNTISHGAGFGILGNAGIDDVKFGSLAVVPEYIYEQYLQQSFEITGYEVERKAKQKVVIVKPPAPKKSCKSLQMLWISELSDALTEAYGKRKIDLLLFNNCYMQVYENAWMLANNIKYLVGAETEFFSYGFDYKKLLERINDDPAIKPDTLVKEIIPDLKEKWRRIGTGRMKDIVISVMDLGKINELSSCFEVVTDFLWMLPDHVIREIIATRQDSVRAMTARPSGHGSTRVITIDLIYFLKLMIHKFSAQKEVVLNAEKFINHYVESINGNLHVGENITGYDAENNDKYGAYGLAIYMPHDLQSETKTDIMNCAYFGRISRNEPTEIQIPLILFKKQSQWDDFIERVVNLL